MTKIQFDLVYSRDRRDGGKPYSEEEIEEIIAALNTGGIWEASHRNPGVSFCPISDSKKDRLSLTINNALHYSFKNIPAGINELVDAHNLVVDAVAYLQSHGLQNLFYSAHEIAFALYGHDDTDNALKEWDKFKPLANEFAQHLFGRYRVGNCYNSDGNVFVSIYQIEDLRRLALAGQKSKGE